MAGSANLTVGKELQDDALLKRSVAGLREKTVGLGIEPYFEPVGMISAKPGEILFQFTVSDVHLNSAGFVHGGVVAILTDAMTNVAANSLQSIAEGPMKGTTLEMNVKYLHGIRKGETILVKAEAVKSGKKFFVCSADFRNADGKLLARGGQTVYRIAPEKFRRSDESPKNPIRNSKL